MINSNRVIKNILGKRTIRRKLRQDIFKLQYNGKKIKLINEQGTELASLQINYDSPEAINISKWKAKIKGHGYGKELIKLILKERPKLWQITTDGLTEMGEKNLKKVLTEFKIIDWRRGAGGAIAIFMRQDAIDYFIDNPTNIFRIDPKLHS